MSSPSNPKIELVFAKDGSPLFQLTEIDTPPRYLASRYSPLKEAERILDNTKPSAELQMIFIMGAGNPSLIYLALKKYKNIPIAVLEKYDQIRELFTEWLSQNHRPLFLQNQTRLLWGVRFDEKELRSWFKEYSVKKVLYLSNQRQIQLYPDFFSPLKDTINKIHSERSSNRSTISKFEKLWLRNLTKNTTQIIKSYPLLACRDWGQGLPVIIVGAGPSLQECLEDLKNHQKRVMIIACDTAFKVLLHHNIYPDFVVAVDPQKINSRYLENISNEGLDRTILVSEPGIGNQGIRHFSHVLMFDSIFPYYQFLALFFNAKGEIDVGGTVISAAYEIAKVFNFSPMSFIGMDFCFREEAYHLQGTMYEEIFFSSLHRFQTFEMFFSQVINHESIPTPNHLGEPVFLDRKFILFKNWLEKKFTQDNRESYNCSWGGIALEGLPHLRFTDFLDKIPTPESLEKKKSTLLQKIYKEISHFRNLRSPEQNTADADFEKVFSQFQQEYNKLINGIKDYQSILKKAIGYIHKKKTDKIVASQEEIINSDSAKIAKPFVEIVIQNTLYKIGESTHKKDEWESLSHLYQELHDACILNLKYLQRTRFEEKRVYLSQ